MLTFGGFTSLVESAFILERYADVRFYTMRQLDSTSFSTVMGILTPFRDKMPSEFGPVPDGNYHISVISSKTDVAPSYKPDLQPLELKPKRWDIWGVDNSYVILECHSNAQLTSQIDLALQSGADMVHSTFRPHVSFLFARTKSRFDVGMIPVPKDPLVFGPEIRKQWNPSK